MTETLSAPRLGPVPDQGQRLSDAEFGHLLARFAPFERAPWLAVAVSGGADSMALALLADRWAQARGGAVTAVTVDHRLRPESSAEAAQVGAWLAARGIAHRVLPWDGPKPVAGIQAAARAARRALLASWCRREGVLHLLLAHHRDDQNETIILRLARHSGPDGLAGMAAVVELPDLRLLRPLLGVARDRLRATLRAMGQAWIEDPSNDDKRFMRVRIRAALARLEAEGLDAAKLVAAIDGLGGDRAAREGRVAALLARAAAIYPEGFAVLDPVALRAAEREESRAALARAILAIGGNVYAPRSNRLERLHHALLDGAMTGGRTLGGCTLVPWRGLALIAREPAAAAGDVAIERPGAYLFDNRFVVTVAGHGPFAGVRLAALGEEGWRQVVAAEPVVRRNPLPSQVRSSLPAVWDLDGVLGVPHLLYRRRGADPDSVAIVSAMFRPRHPLAGSGFSAF